MPMVLTSCYTIKSCRIFKCWSTQATRTSYFFPSCCIFIIKWNWCRDQSFSWARLSKSQLNLGLVVRWQAWSRAQLTQSFTFLCQHSHQPLNQDSDDLWWPLINRMTSSDVGNCAHCSRCLTSERCNTTSSRASRRRRERRLVYWNLVCLYAKIHA